MMVRQGQASEILPSVISVTLRSKLPGKKSKITY